MIFSVALKHGHSLLINEDDYGKIREVDLRIGTRDDYAGPQALMDTPRLALVIFLLLFLFFSPDSHSPSLSQKRELDNSILEERHSLNVLNSSQYGDLDASNDRWLNITGMRRGDGYAWEFLPKVQEKAKEQLRNILDPLGSSGIFKNVSTTSEDSGPEDGTGKSKDWNGLSTMKPFNDPQPMYQNVTSIVRGKWSRSNIGESFVLPSLNLSTIAPRVYYTSNKYNRNITGQAGDLQIQLYEQDSGDSLPDPATARNLKAQMTVRDETSTGDGWELTLFGVHYPQQGGIVLSTTSEKFAGIFALPHFTLSQRAFTLSQNLLNQTLMTAIEEQEADFTISSNPWSSSPNKPSEAIFPVPHCEFLVYLQQHPVDDTTIDLRALEKELRFPTGASMPSAPLVRMSAIIFSPDCGFILETQGPPDFTPQQGLHLNGRKQESYMRIAKRCILAFATVICGQIFLLIRQMKDTSTPSTRSRVSFYTIAMMAFGDGIACMVFMVVSMFVDAAFLPLIATAFLSFLCVSFFGMKFLMDVWTVQAPERQEREREQQRERDRRNIAAPSRAADQAPAAALAQAPVITAGEVDTLPLPVTARRPADPNSTPIIITPDQELDAAVAEDNATTQTTPQTTLGSARREMSALYTKFYFLLLGILFLSLHATTWPVTLRTIYSNTLAFVYLSFWIPQIHRNIIRNCRKALRWEFIVGESVLRLAPIAYVYVVPDNVLFIENDVSAAYGLMGWVWIQICALVSQEILGPRFFVPGGWAPPAYDYHPILREEDEEAGAAMPIGFTQATADPASPTTPKPGESKEKGKRVFDCAICTENIEVSVVPASGIGEGERAASIGAATIFSRRAYMVTPCRHIFHSQCLEGWMRYRLQCPICRESLPPL